MPDKPYLVLRRDQNGDLFMVAPSAGLLTLAEANRIILRYIQRHTVAGAENVELILASIGQMVVVNQSNLHTLREESFHE